MVFKLVESSGCGVYYRGESTWETTSGMWSKWSKEWKLDIMSQIVVFEKRLTSVSLPGHDCLYYTPDLASRGFNTESFIRVFQSNKNLEGEVDNSIIRMYTLGPLAQSKL
jgi:hypothetical protein